MSQHEKYILLTHDKTEDTGSIFVQHVVGPGCVVTEKQAPPCTTLSLRDWSLQGHMWGRVPFGSLGLDCFLDLLKARIREKNIYSQ